MREDFIRACEDKVGSRFVHGGWGTGGYDCCTLVAASFEQVCGIDTGLRGMRVDDSDCIPDLLDKWGCLCETGEILLIRFPKGYHLAVLDNMGIAIHASEIRSKVIRHRLTPYMKRASVARYTLFSRGE